MIQRMLKWTEFAEKVTTRGVSQIGHCNVASRVTKSLEAPKKGMIVFVSSADKNPPHAGKAYKIQDITIEYVTTDNCSPDIPWCLRSLSSLTVLREAVWCWQAATETSKVHFENYEQWDEPRQQQQQQDSVSRDSGPSGASATVDDADSEETLTEHLSDMVSISSVRT